MGSFRVNFASSLSFFFLTVCLSFESPFLSILRGFKAITCKENKLSLTTWQQNQLFHVYWLISLRSTSIITSNRHFTNTMLNMGTRGMGFFGSGGMSYGISQSIGYGLQIPANQLSGSKKVWTKAGYWVPCVWVMAVSTVVLVSSVFIYYLTPLNLICLSLYSPIWTLRLACHESPSEPLNKVTLLCHGRDILPNMG